MYATSCLSFKRLFPAHICLITESLVFHHPSVCVLTLKRPPRPIPQQNLFSFFFCFLTQGLIFTLVSSQFKLGFFFSNLFLEFKVGFISRECTTVFRGFLLTKGNRMFINPFSTMQNCIRLTSLLT